MNALTDKERDALPTIIDRLQAEERKFRDSLEMVGRRGRCTPSDHYAIDAAWREHTKQMRELEKKLRTELGG
jgi:hypothetical protein